MIRTFTEIAVHFPNGTAGADGATDHSLFHLKGNDMYSYDKAAMRVGCASRLSLGLDDAATTLQPIPG
jgi:hypothetical protein